MADNKELGRIHIYCGNGKGKTTCGMGLCVRAAGYGFRVLIYQFMKNNATSERAAMEHLEISLFCRDLSEKFSMRMTEEEKAQRRIFYAEQFRKATQTAVQNGYDVLFLDEIVYTIRAGLFDEAMLIGFLKNKPEHLEVILTRT